MKGYDVPDGYMGYIPNNGYMLFCSDADYKEYYREHVN